MIVLNKVNRYLNNTEGHLKQLKTNHNISHREKIKLQFH